MVEVTMIAAKMNANRAAAGPTGSITKSSGTSQRLVSGTPAPPQPFPRLELGDQGFVTDLIEQHHRSFGGHGRRLEPAGRSDRSPGRSRRPPARS